MRLIFRDAPFLNFREFTSDRRWIDARRFSIEGLGDDPAVLTALIADPWYDHSYAEPTPAEPGPPTGIHGPYRLDAITPAAFVETERTAVVAKIDEWALRLGPLPEEFGTRYREFVDELLPVGHALYELPVLRVTAEHEWGSVVGQEGFIEIVAISPDRTEVTLLVASDD